MTTLLERWHLAAQKVHEDHSEHQRYLLIDAAQLSINSLPWKDLMETKQADNLLRDQPEASAPEVCAWLIAYDHHWVASLLERTLARRPFAFTLLVSALPREKLVGALTRRTRISLSKYRTALLRFYDSASLQALLQVLEPWRCNLLLNNADAWVYVRRDGEIETTGPFTQEVRRCWDWGLSDAELQALEQLGLVDRITAELENNGHLSVNTDPFFIYENVARLISLLKGSGEFDLASLYRFCAVLVELPLTNRDQSELAELTVKHQGDSKELFLALCLWRAKKPEQDLSWAAAEQ